MDLYEKKMKIKCNAWVSSIAVGFFIFALIFFQLFHYISDEC